MSVRDETNEIYDVTLWHALSVWWLCLWRSIVGAIVLGVVFGILVTVVTLPFGAGLESRTLISSLVGLVVGVGWGVVVMRMALRKSYRGFRIALVREY